MVHHLHRRLHHHPPSHHRQHRQLGMTQLPQLLRRPDHPQKQRPWTEHHPLPDGQSLRLCRCCHLHPHSRCPCHLCPRCNLVTLALVYVEPLKHPGFQLHSQLWPLPSSPSTATGSSSCGSCIFSKFFVASWAACLEWPESALQRPMHATISAHTTLAILLHYTKPAAPTT